MQIRQQMTTTVSDDTGTAPQLIKLKDIIDVTDTSSLTKSVEYNKSFAIGTAVLDFSGLTQGRFLYVKPTNDVVLVFNGGSEQITVRAGKTSAMWVNMTALSVVVSGAANQIFIFIGGN